MCSIDAPPAAYRQLPALARASIAARLQDPSVGSRLASLLPENIDPALMEPRASFVTLTEAEQLRGCIGSLEARRPLALDVMHNAIGAAFRDPRFLPLNADEFDAIHISVSVLSPLQAMQARDVAQLLNALRPGKDGLLLGTADGRHRATFLPSVWQQLPQPADFVGRLLQKAGLPADYHGPIRAERYTVSEHREAV